MYNNYTHYLQIKNNFIFLQFSFASTWPSLLTIWGFIFTILLLLYKLYATNNYGPKISNVITRYTYKF